jgi:transcriptional regulator with XRE-family HTH domain
MSLLRARLGRVIRRLRAERGYSQEAFAARARIHRTTMSEIERGVSNVSLDMAERIAKGLGVSLSELVAEAEIERRL